MDHLAQQRIRYLIEHGASSEEPASRDFVNKWCTWLLGLNIAQVVLIALYLAAHLR